MKLIKSTFALAAAVAVGAGVAQAQPSSSIPLTIALTADIKPGNTIQAVGVNNATILAKIGKALNVNLAADHLAFGNDGSILIVDSGGAVVYNLSDGVVYENEVEYGVHSGVGPNNAVLDYYTDGYAYVETDNGNGTLEFWDPVWVGTATSDGEGGFPAFKVVGNVEGCYIYFYYGYDSYVYNELTGHTSDLAYAEEELEVSDGTKATVNCALASGNYKEGFTVWASGYYYSSLYGDGVLFGVFSAAGTQTGGTSSLDDFNGSGNFDFGYTN